MSAAATGLPESLRVVVLAHGTESPAAGVVGRLLEEGAAPSQVVVVHNRTGPSDPPLELPFPGVEVIASPRNLGYTGGMNLGIARQLESDAELILVLTHDVRVLPGTLAELAAVAARHPDHGVLGPALFDPVRGDPFSFGARMSPTGGMGHLTEIPPDAQDGIVPCDSIDGAFMLIRAQVFRDVGSFDEKLFVYAEESELCLRARRAGWRVGVVTAARGEQEVGAPRRPGAYAYLMTRNGLNLAQSAAGWRGIVGGLGRGLIQLAVHGRRLADPRRPADHKRAAHASIVGTLRGAADYFRGRWGPPPSSLPGLGDVQGT